MTKEDILDILNQARDYADRSVQECKDAQELISVAETQSIEALGQYKNVKMHKNL
jgi:hypothetical protein